MIVNSSRSSQRIPVLKKSIFEYRMSKLTQLTKDKRN